MVLSLSDLLALTSKPRISDLDLILLQELYRECLMPYAYDYMLSDGRRIQLYFNEDNFCHLLGLESVAKAVTRNTFVHDQHSGWAGWNRIKSGTLTLASFRAFGRSHFDQLSKRKVIYFYNLPKLLQSGSAMVKYVPIPSSRLAVELILFDKYDGSWVHIGLEKESDGVAYFPKSFFVERITAPNPNSRFIQGQPYLYAVDWKYKYNRYPKMIKRKNYRLSSRTSF